MSRTKALSMIMHKALLFLSLGSLSLELMFAWWLQSLICTFCTAFVSHLQTSALWGRRLSWTRSSLSIFLSRVHFTFLLLISMPNPIWGSSLVEPCIWDSWSREDHLKFSNCTLMERHAHTEGDGLVPSESETRWCCNPSFFGHGQDHQQLKQSKKLFA